MMRGGRRGLRQPGDCRRVPVPRSSTNPTEEPAGLSDEMADRQIREQRLIAQACEALGDRENAERWSSAGSLSAARRAPLNGLRRSPRLIRSKKELVPVD